MSELRKAPETRRDWTGRSYWSHSPWRSPSSVYWLFSLLAEKAAEVREEQEDVLLLLSTKDHNPLKARLVQHMRSLGAKSAKILKVSMVAAREGTSAAQRVFVPAPVYLDLDDDEVKRLEKYRKEHGAVNSGGC